jgi:hypothetical protein
LKTVAGIQERNRRLQRCGVGALLEDRGAFSIVFPDDDERAADTPAEATWESASEATFVPTTDFQVTAPRIG